MAARTLYFSNPDTQAVQKIEGVLEQPTIYTLGDAEEIYKAPHRDVFEEIYPDELGSSVSSEYSSGSSSGLEVPGWASLTSTNTTGSGSANATSSRIWVFKPVAVNSVIHHSDERVHAPHRQDRIKLNYWKVIFADDGDATFAMIPLEQYPVFAPNPPGWWTDPTV